jgi:Rrf2 family protein
MKLHTNVRYAVRVIFALSSSPQEVSICSVSEKTGIAPRAVELVHKNLKRHGITTSSVGAKGGIALAKSLAEITLGKLVEIFDNGIEFFVCTGEKSNCCPDMDECSMRYTWGILSDKIQQEMDSLSLEYIFREYTAQKAKAMRKAKCI